MLVVDVTLAQLRGGLTSSCMLECHVSAPPTEQSQHLHSGIGGTLSCLVEWCFVLGHSGS
jgi:hypothetical protein